MTAGEQASLNHLVDYVKEWRSEDKMWKENVSARLKELEDDKVARDAVTKDRERIHKDTLWKVATIVGFMSTTIGGMIALVGKVVLGF